MNKVELDMILELWDKPIDVLNDWYDSFEDESNDLLKKRENMEIRESEFEREYNQSEHNKWILKSIIDKVINKVSLYNVDWKHSGVSELEVDISKKRKNEHIEDFLKDWFITNHNEIPLSYEIKDLYKLSNRLKTSLN